MDYKILDNLTIQELKKLSEEISFRINNQRLLAERKANFNELDLSVRALNSLGSTDIKNMEELNKISSDEIMKIKNIGKTTVLELSEYFKYLGMDWDCEF